MILEGALRHVRFPADYEAPAVISRAPTADFHEWNAHVCGTSWQVDSSKLFHVSTSVYSVFLKFNLSRIKPKRICLLFYLNLKTCTSTYIIVVCTAFSKVYTFYFWYLICTGTSKTQTSSEQVPKTLWNDSFDK